MISMSVSSAFTETAPLDSFEIARRLTFKGSIFLNVFEPGIPIFAEYNPIKILYANLKNCIHSIKYHCSIRRTLLVNYRPNMYLNWGPFVGKFLRNWL